MTEDTEAYTTPARGTDAPAMGSGCGNPGCEICSDPGHCGICGADMTGRSPGTMTALGAPICQDCLDGLP
jgi:hypothetical protein